MNYTNNKGAIWAKCDLHVHTPCSIVNGYGQNNDETWSRFLKDLRNLPKAFKILGINDYWFLDGYGIWNRERSSMPPIR